MRDTRISTESRRYHHGDLKSAMLAEAETILEQQGIQALTLRAAARAVGVSHTAPVNHFGDLTGLLSELAAVGFNRFSVALGSARTTSDDPVSQAKAIGRAYVAFARAHRGLFALMFRSERLDASRPALRTAIEAARETLRPTGTVKAVPPLQQAAQGVARWALVHGFAMLLLDGRLDGLIGSLADGTDADTLLEAVLAAIRIGD